MISGPQKRLVASALEADRRYRRSGIGTSGLHCIKYWRSFGYGWQCEISTVNDLHTNGICRRVPGHQGTILRIYGQ